MIRDDVGVARVGWAIAVVAVLLCAPVHADEPEPEQSGEDASRAAASMHFRRGVELHREGAYRAALIELIRANEIAPDYRVLFNIGQTHYALGEYVEAARALEAYLTQGGEQINPTRRGEVEATLRELNQRVALLRITADRDGASVYVDGREVGKTPLPAPISVSLGRHQISATSEDGAIASDVVDVAGGDERTLALALRAPATRTRVRLAPPRAETEEPSSWSKASRRDKWGYGLLASGTVLGVAGGLMAWQAKRADSNYDLALRARPGNAAKIASAHDELERNALIADVLFGSALVFAATGLVLVLVREPVERQARIKFVTVGLGAGTLLATGSF